MRKSSCLSVDLQCSRHFIKRSDHWLRCMESIYFAVHCSHLPSGALMLMVEDRKGIMPVKVLLPPFPEVHFWIFAGNLNLTCNGRGSRLKSIISIINKYIYLSVPPIMPPERHCAHYRLVYCIHH